MVNTNGRSRTQTQYSTFTAPVEKSFFCSIAKRNVWFPNLLFCIVQDLAKGSSEWAVTMSSQSFDRAEEDEIAVIEDNFKDVMGIERFVAFLATEPGV